MNPSLRRRDGVLIIELHAPASRNALDDAVVAAIGGAVADAGQDDDLRGIVLTGAGGAFSAGGDFRALAELLLLLDTEGEAAVSRRVRANARVVETLLASPLPTVAALSGPVVGAAVGLACACDLRVADATVRLSTGFARLGLTSDLGTGPLLTRMLGLSGERLLHDARVVGLAEADALGLVRVAKAGLDVLDAAVALVGRLEPGVRRRGRLDRADTADAFGAALDREADAFAASLASDAARMRLAAFLPA